MSAYANAFLFGDTLMAIPVGGSEASLSNIKHSDLLAYYAEMLGGDRLIISVSGDFESPHMRESLTAAFGDWRPASEPLPSIDAPTEAAGGSVYLIDKPGATQTYFYIGNVGVARGFAAAR